MAGIDYEDVFTSVHWDLEKARYLLSDLREYFECPFPECPPGQCLENVRREFKHIVVVLGLLDDLVEKLDETVRPLL